MATAHADDYYPVRMIGLKSLRVDPEIQSRCHMDMGHADAITGFLLDRKEHLSDAIIVFDDGFDLWVADGFHRVHAYKEAARLNRKFLQIRCEVRPGTRIDAIVYSAGANQTRTWLPRSKEDIGRAIYQLLDLPEWRERSGVDIGLHVGVSKTTANRWIRRYFREKDIATPPQFKTVMGHRRKRSRLSGQLTLCEIRPRPGDGRNVRYRASVAGKPVDLGTDREVAEARLEAIKAQLIITPREVRRQLNSGQLHAIIGRARAQLASIDVDQLGADLGTLREIDPGRADRLATAVAAIAEARSVLCEAYTRAATEPDPS